MGILVRNLGLSVVRSCGWGGGGGFSHALTVNVGQDAGTSGWARAAGCFWDGSLQGYWQASVPGLVGLHCKAARVSSQHGGWLPPSEPWEGEMQAQCPLWPRLKVTHLPFCTVPLATQVRPIWRGGGLDSCLNTRRRGSLGNILEAGCHNE